MATEPTVMKMRLAEIHQFVMGLQQHHDPYTHAAWERGYESAEVKISKEIRKIMGRLPKGYVKGEKSLKTIAKERYLLWRENQAKGDWKKLSDDERAVWEGYVEDGLEFGTIREKELKRAEGIKAGDRVTLVPQIIYLNTLYPVGSSGEVTHVYHDDVKGTPAYRIKFDDRTLRTLNTYPHEIRKA